MSLKTCHWESFLMVVMDGLRLCMDLVATLGDGCGTTEI